MKLKHKLASLLFGFLLLVSGSLAVLAPTLQGEASAASVGGTWSYGSVVNGRLTVKCSGSTCPEGTGTLYYTGTKWSFAPDNFQNSKECFSAGAPFLCNPDESKPANGSFIGCKAGTPYINSPVTLGNTAAFTKYSAGGGAVGGDITVKLTVGYVNRQ